MGLFWLVRAVLAPEDGANEEADVDFNVYHRDTPNSRGEINSVLSSHTMFNAFIRLN